MSGNKPYCRIDFKDCSIEFDWTICPFDDVIPYVESLRGDFVRPADGDEPEIKISLIWMTDVDYEKWFNKHVKP